MRGASCPDPVWAGPGAGAGGGGLGRTASQASASFSGRAWSPASRHSAELLPRAMEEQQQQQQQQALGMSVPEVSLTWSRGRERAWMAEVGSDWELVLSPEAFSPAPSRSLGPSAAPSSTLAYSASLSCPASAPTQGPQASSTTVSRASTQPGRGVGLAPGGHGWALSERVGAVNAVSRGPAAAGLSGAPQARSGGATLGLLSQELRQEGEGEQQGSGSPCSGASASASARRGWGRQGWGGPGAWGPEGTRLRGGSDVPAQGWGPMEGDSSWLGPLPESPSSESLPLCQLASSASTRGSDTSTTETLSASSASASPASLDPQEMQPSTCGVPQAQGSSLHPWPRRTRQPPWQYGSGKSSRSSSIISVARVDEEEEHLPLATASLPAPCLHPGTSHSAQDKHAPARDPEPPRPAANHGGLTTQASWQGPEQGSTSGGGRGHGGKERAAEGTPALKEALRHSQTRARIAEAAALDAGEAAQRGKEVLLREMARTFSLRQWALMLQVENARLMRALAMCPPPWPPACTPSWSHWPCEYGHARMLQAPTQDLEPSRTQGPGELSDVSPEPSAGSVDVQLLLLLLAFALGLTAGVGGGALISWRCGILVLGSVA